MNITKNPVLEHRANHNKTTERSLMSLDTNLSRHSFSDLEKVLSELTRLQSENIDLLMELSATKKKVEEARALAQIEATVYSGIRKYFK